MKSSMGRIVHYHLHEGEWRPLHVLGVSGDMVDGWVLLSPDDVGADKHGVLPAGVHSPWRAYRDIPQGEAVGCWRWPRMETA